MLITEKTDIHSLDISGIIIINNPNKDYYILIRKETGSWKTVNKSKTIIVQDLYINKLTFNEYKNKYPNEIALLESLFYAGILNINNQTIIKNDPFKTCKITQQHPSLFVIKYTRKCNLKCSYCYAESDNKQNYSMNNETLLYIMRKIINTYGDNIYTLVLHGGEPTLRFNDIPLLVKELKALSKNIIINIQTNATLVTKKIATFLKEENIHVGISLDGFDKKTNIHRHYSNGNSSFANSIKGLENLFSSGINPGILSVITPDNQNKLLDIFDFYTAKGIKKFGFNPIFHGGRGKEDKQEIDTENLVSIYLELIQKIDKINSYLNKKELYISERNISNLVNNLTSWERNYMCSMSPCGAGRMTLAFDTDGSIYPCDNFISQKEFCIGNIFDIKDLKNTIEKNVITHKITSNNINNTKECFGCPWKKICTYHCSSDIYFRHQSFNHTHSMCSFIKKIIPEIIDMLHYEQINPKHFIPC